jgi:hypothetical protein
MSADELVTQCAWCHRIKRAGEWIYARLPGKVNEYRGQQVTHGICERCARIWQARARKYGSMEAQA